MSNERTLLSADETDSITLENVDATPNDVLRDLADDFDAAANEFDAGGHEQRAKAYRHGGEIIRQTIAEHSPDE